LQWFPQHPVANGTIIFNGRWMTAPMRYASMISDGSEDSDW
jgi:hypothetical protein